MFYIVLRGWLARRKYARLREVHQLQLVFIRKFSDDISLTGQLYKTKMDNHYQYDKKRRLKQNLQQKNDEDDDQIEKTLNFFDAMLDPYLTDQDTIEDIKSNFLVFIKMILYNFLIRSTTINYHYQ
jgi:hypothetical protein